MANTIDERTIRETVQKNGLIVLASVESMDPNTATVRLKTDLNIFGFLNDNKPVPFGRMAPEIGSKCIFALEPTPEGAGSRIPAPAIKAFVEVQDGKEMAFVEAHRRVIARYLPD